MSLLGIAAPIVSALLITIMGYYLTDRVNQTLEEQALELRETLETARMQLTRDLEGERLQLTGASEMQQLFNELADAGSEPTGSNVSRFELLRRRAVIFAAFGRHALAPFIGLLDTADPDLQDAAKAGLRAIGLTDPSVVCTGLGRVIGNRTAIYDWRTHESAIELIGDLTCVTETAAVESLEAVLDGPNAERYIGGLPDEDAEPFLRDDLVRTLEILSRPTAVGR